jgi:hypothetical protein
VLGCQEDGHHSELAAIMLHVLIHSMWLTGKSQFVEEFSRSAVYFGTLNSKSLIFESVAHGFLLLSYLSKS